MSRTLLFFALLLLCHRATKANTWYAVNTGNWSSSTVWNTSTTGGGSSGVPTGGDTVQFFKNIVTADTSPIPSSGTLTFMGNIGSVNSVGSQGYLLVSPTGSQTFTVNAGTIQTQGGVPQGLIQCAGTSGTVTVNASLIVGSTAANVGPCVQQTNNNVVVINCPTNIGGSASNDQAFILTGPATVNGNIYGGAGSSGFAVGNPATTAGTVQINGDVIAGASPGINGNDFSFPVTIYIGGNGSGNHILSSTGAGYGFSQLSAAQQINLVVTGTCGNLFAGAGGGVTLTNQKDFIQVNGVVTGGTNSGAAGINLSTSSTVSVTGSVLGSAANAINFNGSANPILTVTGTVQSTGNGIAITDTTSGTNAITINGPVLGGTGVAISATGPVTLNVNGNVTAGTAGAGIVCSGASPVVSVSGNVTGNGTYGINMSGATAVLSLTGNITGSNSGGVAVTGVAASSTILGSISTSPSNATFMPYIGVLPRNYNTNTYTWQTGVPFGGSSVLVVAPSASAGASIFVGGTSISPTAIYLTGGTSQISGSLTGSCSGTLVSGSQPAGSQLVSTAGTINWGGTTITGLANVPAANDVRNGIATGTTTGNLNVPTPAQVQAGVHFDSSGSSTGTLYIRRR